MQHTYIALPGCVVGGETDEKKKVEKERLKKKGWLKEERMEKEKAKKERLKNAKTKGKQKQSRGGIHPTAHQPIGSQDSRHSSGCLLPFSRLHFLLLLLPCPHSYSASSPFTYSPSCPVLFVALIVLSLAGATASSGLRLRQWLGGKHIPQILASDAHS